MSESAKPIRDMFDKLVPEYDRFNRISSFGLDVAWRREVARHFHKGSHILDVGTGTGDLARELLNGGMRVTGVDFSSNMIDAARRKLGQNPNADFQVSSANRMPFEPGTFEGLCSAFVVRNLHHGGILWEAVREFHRVLRPGGLMVHLELSTPPKGIMSLGHRAYVKAVLPLIGRLHFGRRWPSRYLEKTIESFPAARTVCQQIRWAGFDRVAYYPLSGGIAGLFVGSKC